MDLKVLFSSKNIYFAYICCMSAKISVIISTYNQPRWLEKVLWGYDTQTYRNFELLIADDGSGEETKQLIRDITPQLSYPLVHVWQEDDGFQKSRILNKALLAASGEYIVMSDGDCIPRKDFLAVHDKKKEKGRFLSGGYFMLPMETSLAIDKEIIHSGKCFEVQWLKDNGLGNSYKNLKLTAGKQLSPLLNTLTPTSPTWNGHNASGWKADIFAVNGFDERMQYGGQDRELGERLENSGIKGKQIRYSAICIHLDHPRGYATKESWERNFNIRKNTRDQKVKFTDFGLKEN